MPTPTPAFFIPQHEIHGNRARCAFDDVRTILLGDGRNDVVLFKVEGKDRGSSSPGKLVDVDDVLVFADVSHRAGYGRWHGMVFVIYSQNSNIKKISENRSAMQADSTASQMCCTLIFEVDVKRTLQAVLVYTLAGPGYIATKAIYSRAVLTHHYACAPRR